MTCFVLLTVDIKKNPQSICSTEGGTIAASVCMTRNINQTCTEKDAFTWQNRKAVIINR